MSVIICSICEENRKAVSDAVQEAIKILGRQAKGCNPDLVKQNCPVCQSFEKTFNINTTQYRREFRYSGTIDSLGNFVIDAPSNYNDYEGYNTLELINFLKNTLENNASQLLSGKYNFGFNCVCGHSFKE